MCTTEYIKERAEAIERDAQSKIDIIDELLPQMTLFTTRTEQLPRAGGLLVLLLHMQAELMEEKAAALRVIESALELRRTTKDLA
jgi:hypothetical protein